MKLDHIIFNSSHELADERVLALENSGFRVHNRSVSRDGVKKSQFILMQGSYLEFVSWERDTTKAEGISAFDYSSYLRSGTSSIAFATNKINRINSILRNQYPDIGDVELHYEELHSSKEPTWAVQTIPETILPGCTTYFVEYKKDVSHLLDQVGPNGISEINGVCFSSSTPVASRRRWLSVMRRLETEADAPRNTIDTTSSQLCWHTQSVDLSFDHISEVAFHCESVAQAKRWLTKGGFSPKATNARSLKVEHPLFPDTAFTFQVRD